MRCGIWNVQKDWKSLLSSICFFLAVLVCAGCASNIQSSLEADIKVASKCDHVSRLNLKRIDAKKEIAIYKARITGKFAPCPEQGGARGNVLVCALDTILSNPFYDNYTSHSLRPNLKTLKNRSLPQNNQDIQGQEGINEELKEAAADGVKGENVKTVRDLLEVIRKTKREIERSSQAINSSFHAMEVALNNRADVPTDRAVSILYELRIIEKNIDNLEVYLDNEVANRFNNDVVEGLIVDIESYVTNAHAFLVKAAATLNGDVTLFYRDYLRANLYYQLANHCINTFDRGLIPLENALGKVDEKTYGILSLGLVTVEESIQDQLNSAVDRLLNKLFDRADFTEDDLFKNMDTGTRNELKATCEPIKSAIERGLTAAGVGKAARISCENEKSMVADLNGIIAEMNLSNVMSDELKKEYPTGRLNRGDVVKKKLFNRATLEDLGKDAGIPQKIRNNGFYFGNDYNDFVSSFAVVSCSKYAATENYKSRILSPFLYKAFIDKYDFEGGGSYLSGPDERTPLRPAAASSAAGTSPVSSLLTYASLATSGAQSGVGPAETQALSTFETYMNFEWATRHELSKQLIRRERGSIQKQHDQNGMPHCRPDELVVEQNALEGAASFIARNWENDSSVDASYTVPPTEFNVSSVQNVLTQVENLQSQKTEVAVENHQVMNLSSEPPQVPTVHIHNVLAQPSSTSLIDLCSALRRGGIYCVKLEDGSLEVRPEVYFDTGKWSDSGVATWLLDFVRHIDEVKEEYDAEITGTASSSEMPCASLEKWVSAGTSVLLPDSMYVSKAKQGFHLEYRNNSLQNKVAQVECCQPFSPSSKDGNDALSFMRAAWVATVLDELTKGKVQVRDINPKGAATAFPGNQRKDRSAAIKLKPRNVSRLTPQLQRGMRSGVRG